MAMSLPPCRLQDDRGLLSSGQIGERPWFPSRLCDNAGRVITGSASGGMSIALDLMSKTGSLGRTPSGCRRDPSQGCFYGLRRL